MPPFKSALSILIILFLHCLSVSIFPISVSLPQTITQGEHFSIYVDAIPEYKKVYARLNSEESVRLDYNTTQKVFTSVFKAPLAPYSSDARLYITAVLQDDTFYRDHVPLTILSPAVDSPIEESETRNGVSLSNQFVFLLSSFIFFGLVFLLLIKCFLFLLRRHSTGIIRYVYKFCLQPCIRCYDGLFVAASWASYYCKSAGKFFFYLLSTLCVFFICYAGIWLFAFFIHYR